MTGEGANDSYSPAHIRFDAMASQVLNPNVSVQLNIRNLGDMF